MIKGKELIRLNENTHIVFFMDSLTKNNRYNVYLNKGIFGKEKISKKVYTDGDIIIISKNDHSIEGYVEVIFELEDASWMVKKAEEGIHIFIKEDYENRINIKDEKLKETVDYCISESKKRIVNKKAFASQIGKIALQEDLPFELVLAFKGDVEKIREYITLLKKAISNCYGSYSDITQSLLSKDISLRIESMENMGFNLKGMSYKSNYDVCKYTKSCLEKGKIIRHKRF